MSAVAMHSSVDEGWMTPGRMFAAMRKAAGGFDIDLAADASATKCRDWLGPGSAIAENALDVGWSAIPMDRNVSDSRPMRRGFLNPPYSLKQKHAGVPGMDIAEWAWKCWHESRLGFEVWGIFPYATQTEWWREWVEGHDVEHGGWSGHAAMEAWRLDHRVQFEPTEATKTRIREEFERGERDTAKATGAGHNVAIVIWKPNPGFVAPWAPTVRYWSYR